MGLGLKGRQGRAGQASGSAPACLLLWGSSSPYGKTELSRSEPELTLSSSGKNESEWLLKQCLRGAWGWHIHMA